jgi:hypothetical protein
MQGLKAIRASYFLFACLVAGCGGGGGGGTSPIPNAIVAIATAPAATAGGAAVAQPTASPAAGSGTTKVSPTATPSASSGAKTTPVATPTPSSGALLAIPTATPLPASVVTLSSAIFQNAQEYTAGFTPYSSISPFNTKVSANPTFLSNSATIVANQFPGGQNTQTIRANEAGIYDYGHPRFIAASTDPVINIKCTEYCGAPDNGGVPATMHVPAVARPAGGSDSHMDVVQPDGTEISMWGVTRPSSNWTAGATLSAANIANCGSITTGTGWLAVGPGPTAAGYCTNAGVVTANELITGQINHALIIIGQCAVGSQYPSENGASTQQCTSGIGPPLGGREWYDVPCATTQASSSLQPWEKAILCALNVYGGYMADNGGGGQYFTGTGAHLEDEEPWYDFDGAGYTSPFAPLAAQGWTSVRVQSYGSAVGTRWIGADPWNPTGVNFPAHIHWLAPCSAQGTC